MSAATWQVVSADGHFGTSHISTGSGRSASNSLPAFSAKETDYFRVLPSENSLTVFVQVSNFTRKRGGLAWAPVLGTRSQVQRASKTALAYDGITFGVLFIGFLFHLVIFWQRRDDYASLFFGFMCGTLSLRALIMTRLFIVTGALEGTGETYERLVAIEYFTLPALAMVTGLFIDALLPRPWLRRFVLSWGVGLGSLLILFSLMADIALLTSTLHFYQLYLVPFFILLGGHLIFETYRGHPAGAWLLLAFAVFIGGALNDILYTNGVINTGYISTYTFMGFVLIQGGILAARASSAHRKARHLTKNLQEEVDSQTRELQLQTREAELARAEASDLRDKAELKNQRLRELDEQKTAFFPKYVS